MTQAPVRSWRTVPAGLAAPCHGRIVTWQGLNRWCHQWVLSLPEARAFSHPHFLPLCIFFSFSLNFTLGPFLRRKLSVSGPGSDKTLHFSMFPSIKRVTIIHRTIDLLCALHKLFLSFCMSAVTRVLKHFFKE